MVVPHTIQVPVTILQYHALTNPTSLYSLLHYFDLTWLLINLQENRDAILGHTAVPQQSLYFLTYDLNFMFK